MKKENFWLRHLRFFVFMGFNLFFLCHTFSLLGQEDNPLFAFGATLASEMQISLEGGTHQSGKRTFLSGSTIDFGNVSFIHPEHVQNGDAYVEDQVLNLEAVITVSMSFSGVGNVALDLTRLTTSANPFHDAGYSLDTNRSSVLQSIYTDPRSNRVTTLDGPSNVTLRLNLQILPQQQGRLTDRFNLTATAL